MRDLILTAVVFGSLPYILKRPFIGLLMWVWLGIMNPHQMTWGFAASMPFALMVGACTLVSFVVHFNKLYKFTVNGITLTMMAFVLWMCISPLFSFHPDNEYFFWVRVMKVQLMVLIALFLIGNRDEINKMVWVLTMSVGFYGVKGGLFTIATGGTYRVFGPDYSYIADNNHMALAIIMTVPLFRYLQLQSANRWVRRGCVLAMFLCVAAALGSQSRGALLAIGAMSSFLWLKSRNKAMIGIILVLAVPLVFLVMPESWTSRMNTIKTYDQDESALGRINAWWMAWNLALDRFPIGGGFAVYELDVFARYAPIPEPRAAHSIYFQVLGEHGFGGLFLFMTIWGLAWICANAILRKARDRKDLEWARDLAAMSQVSLIGYLVGGAFLSLSYFELPFYIVVLLVVLRRIVDAEVPAKARPVASKPVPVAMAERPARVPQ